MRRRVWLAGLLGLALLVVIAGIGLMQVKGATGLPARDQARVLDAWDHPILQAENQTARTYLAAVTATSRQTGTCAFVKRPKDAQLLYRYQFSHQGHVLGRRVLYFDIYSNYPLVTVGGLPFLRDLTWSLDDRTYKQMKQPRLFLKGEGQGGDSM
ncbi:hypothetical protein ACKQTC_07770 [Peptococcus simiae]|uniref:DUF4830 domain-containing protein n=1 Tax=Peptococcus simiae TaxID=1643805 RepID=A0ABW9H079_9FIRM